MTRGHSSFPKGAEGITFGNVLRLFLNAEIVCEIWRNMTHSVIQLIRTSASVFPK
jgi:hypothetical protein